LASRLPLIEIEKYDKYIPQAIQYERVGIERLDLNGALLVAREMIQQAKPATR
jgi:hypothetical protein